MKTLLFFIIILLTTSINTMGQNIDEIIGQIKSKFAPDKRTAIFEIVYTILDNELILEGEVSDKVYKDELIKTLQSVSNYKLIDKVEVLPSSKLGTRIYGIVNLSVCNIRSKPDHPAELSTQALMGTPVRILKEQGGWFLIQTPNEYLGWVDDDGIARVSTEEMHKWIDAKKIIYKNFYGFVFSDEKLSEPISDIVAGNLVELLNSFKNYYKVKLPDGRIGFIKSEEASIFQDWFESLRFDTEAQISISKQMIGFPYLWGGTSIKGIDCSGFINTIYFLNGMILPRDANQQAMVGDEIPFDPDLSKLKPGDLIYFGRKATDNRPERITHVGMYLGNKKFIHSSGRVRIDSFDKNDPNYNEYRYNTIVRVKRILDNKELIERLKIINNKFYLKEFYR